MELKEKIGQRIKSVFIRPYQRQKKTAADHTDSKDKNYGTKRKNSTKG